MRRAGATAPMPGIHFSPPALCFHRPAPVPIEACFRLIFSRFGEQLTGLKLTQAYFVKMTLFFIKRADPRGSKQNKKRVWLLAIGPPMQFKRSRLFICLAMLIPLFAFMKNMGKPGQKSNAVSTVDSAKGMLELIVQFYSRTVVPPFTYQARIWYRNELVVEEINSMDFVTDTAGRETVSSHPLYYLCYNKSSPRVYAYRNFADTAVVSTIYSNQDSIIKAGALNFYRPEAITYVSKPESLPDTVISNINYSRIKFERETKGYRFNSIGYFRCDQKASIFRFMKYDNKACPMVRLDDMADTSFSVSSSREIRVLRDSLTNFEEQVLTTWENRLQEPDSK